MKTAPQQRRSRETLDRILVAANEEFAAAGLHGVTTTGIATRANVSVGSLYRFFDGKEAIAEAIVESYLEDAMTTYRPVLEDINSADDIVPALRRLVRAAAELQEDHPGFYRITQDSSPQSDDATTAAVRGRLVEMFSAVLDRFEIGESTEARQRVVALVTETVRHTLAGTKPGSAGRAELVAELESMSVGYFANRLGLPADEIG